MRLIYSFLLFLLSPLLLIYTLVQSYKRGGDFRFIAQRMGLYFAFRPSTQQAIWFHAASVGETKAVAPLVMAVSKALPGARIVLSTNTCEAAALIKKTMPASIDHYYFTTDFPIAVQRLVKLIKPRALFVVETEIWPNLYWACYRHRVPIVIVNARLSRKSMSGNSMVKSLYRQVLDKVQLIAARNEKDAQRYQELGADKNKIQIVGNIKFAAALSEREAPHSIVEGKQYILFVSTHEGEELIAGQLKQRFGYDIPFIVVPRHPQRRASIVKSLEALDLNIALRSEGQAFSNDIDIYLADTLGEVNGFLPNALMVFVGGSMVPVGGHNVLEPAIYGKPVLVGPHLEGIQSEVQLLKQNQALIECANQQVLFSAINELVGNPDKAAAMGCNARRAIEQCEDILKRYRDICLDTLGESVSDDPDA